MRSRPWLTGLLLVACSSSESSPAAAKSDPSGPGKEAASDAADSPAPKAAPAPQEADPAKTQEPKGAAGLKIDDLPIPPGIKKERVQKDLDLLVRFAGEFPLGSVEEVVAALDDTGKGCTAHPQGFGIDARTCGIGAGYASCRVSFASFGGEIFDAEASCRFNDRRWEQYEPVGRQLFAATVSKVGFKVDGRSAKLAFRDMAAKAKATAALAEVLGPRGETSVPPELADAYVRLTNPRGHVTVGTYCGAAGTPPEGHQAMNELVAAKADDLLRSVLRGMNAGGRLYGYIGLKLLGKNTADDDATYDTLTALEAEVHTCGGCMLGTVKAADVDLTDFGPK